MSKLVVEDITKEFPTQTQPLHVLRGISFEIESGNHLAIVGPSGSGKSTLLSIIGTLERPTSGQILLDGQNPFQMPEKVMANFRNQSIGFVFQDHHLLPQCSVIENVLIPTLAGGVTTPEAMSQAVKLCERVGLGDRLDHRPAALSGGERQRAAVARALIHQPLLLLADEPTGNLDRTTAEQIADLFLDLHQLDGMMLVVVTHSQRLAKRMGQQLTLDEGRLVV